MALLVALTLRERAELMAELARLYQTGRLNARTTYRLGLCGLGLGRGELRASAVDRYHAADCDVLLTGSVLEGNVAALFGDKLGVAVQVAVRELSPAPAEPEAPAEDEPPALMPEPELLPAGFTIDGESLERNATTALVHQEADAQARRVLFGDAIRAHRAGALAEWMAGHPEAVIAEAA